MIKIKPLTKEQILISLDRLTRFKNPEIKYLRVFKDIITCKPGITGLWQASGRSNVNFDNRCRLDSFYSKHKCLIFDLKIFTKTFSAVLNSEGAK